MTSPGFTIPGTAVAGIIVAGAAVTDTGKKRQVNEDSFLAELPVFLVADGMGGYEAGDRASSAVVDAFRENIDGQGFASLDDIRQALAAADDRVAEVAGKTTRGAGSTVAGVVLVEHNDEPYWLIFHIGDSRVYRHNGSDLQQLTVDHSLGQELIDRGELDAQDLATFTDRNVITRAIGAADSTADSIFMPVTNGERILICSDGLTGEVTDEAIRAILTMSGPPGAAAAALVNRAVQNGGRDNITVIVLDVISGGRTRRYDASTGGPLGFSELSESSIDETTVRV